MLALHPANHNPILDILRGHPITQPGTAAKHYWVRSKKPCAVAGLSEVIPEIHMTQALSLILETHAFPSEPLGRPQRLYGVILVVPKHYIAGIRTISSTSVVSGPRSIQGGLAPLGGESTTLHPQYSIGDYFS